jgi:HK97 gp10 family phage protein
MRPIMKTRIEGLPDLQRSLAEQPEKVRLGIIDALKIIALLVRNRAVERIQKGPKTGRIYRRGSISHQASAPGEAPATDTGKLASSAEWEVDETSLWAVISFSAFYARMLEFGTRFIRPRPFIFPTLDELKGRFVEIFKASIGARLKQ